MRWLVFWLAIINFSWSGSSLVAATAATSAADSLHQVTFSYDDLNYEQVLLSGSFTDWVRIPLAKTGQRWSITLEIPDGPQHYRFTVADLKETWDAIDPDNPMALNHVDFGWVSIIDWKTYREPAHDELDPAANTKRNQYKKRIEGELDFNQPDISSDSYQRVDGLTLGETWNHIGPTDSLEPSTQARIGFGFSSGQVTAGLTILQPLVHRHILGLKLSLYDRTDYSDQTGIGNSENSLAAFFLHKDFRDYFRNKGVRGSLVFKPMPWLRLEAGLLAEEHFALSARSVWSIGKGDFEANPAADEGSLRSLTAQLWLGKSSNHLHLDYERSAPDLLGGSFDFEQITATARGRLELSERSSFDARLKIGRNLQGRLPVQRQFVLGGLGTVRGYEYQSVLRGDPTIDSEAPLPHGGQSMVLGNLEYTVELSDCLGVVLFYDAGMAWEDREAAFGLNQIKTSAGLGFKPGDSDWLRLDLIQKLDDRSSKPVFQFRLGRVF